ncbi:MAG TPA: hypothetical protein VHD81_06105 [Mycobacteriales bacterium]|nr:hypothetical protein [Mycobacteriales bacterium]
MSAQMRPTKRWAATALIAGSMSAVLAAPISVGTAAGATTHHVRAEKPRLLANGIRRGVIALHAHTNPAIEHATVYFYKISHGEKTLVGYESTGPAGRAHVRLHLAPGSVHRFVARWVRIHNQRFNASNATVPRRSHYSNVVRFRTPS